VLGIHKGLGVLFGRSEDDLDAWRGGVFAAPNAADRNFAQYSDEEFVIV
jgi:hypothetical protein